MFKRIVDHKYNELYQKKQQLTQQLQVLDKKGGEEQEIKELEKQLNQAEKKLNNYLEKRKESYPTCPFCSQKVSLNCLMVAGCPRNYHNECWIKVRKEEKLSTCAFCGKEFEGCIVVGNYHRECFEIKKEKESNPYLFAKVERLEREMMAMRSKKH